MSLYSGNTTNFATHLEHHHPAEYSSFLKESGRTSASVSASGSSSSMHAKFQYCPALSINYINHCRMNTRSWITVVKISIDVHQMKEVCWTRSSTTNLPYWGMPSKGTEKIVWRITCQNRFMPTRSKKKVDFVGVDLVGSWSGGSWPHESWPRGSWSCGSWSRGRTPQNHGTRMTPFDQKATIVPVSSHFV